MQDGVQPVRRLLSVNRSPEIVLYIFLGIWGSLSRNTTLNVHDFSNARCNFHKHFSHRVNVIDCWCGTYSVLWRYSWHQSSVNCNLRSILPELQCQNIGCIPFETGIWNSTDSKLYVCWKNFQCFSQISSFLHVVWLSIEDMGLKVNAQAT